jgi:hypothetical protein
MLSRPRASINVSKLLLAVSFTSALSSVAAAQAEDACRDVLSIGFTDVFNRSYSGSLESSIRNWSCLEESKSFWDSHSGGLSLGNKIVSLGATESGEGGGNVTIKDCNELNGYLKNETVEQIASAVLSPIAADAIRAWRDCMGGVSRASGNGVIARVESYSPVDGKFQIHLTWRNTYTDQKLPVIAGYSLDNADCENCKDELEHQSWRIFSSGRPFHDVVLRLTRKDNNKRTTFTMSTDQGPLHPSVWLPVFSPPVTGHCSRNCTSCVVQNHVYVCLECALKVSTILTGGSDHFDIPESQKGLLLSCYPLPRGKTFSITTQGKVWPDFTNNYGNHGGDIGGNVDWVIISHLAYDLGDANGTKRVTFAQSNIRSPTNLLTLSASGTVGDSAIVNAEILVQHLSMWPDSHGPLALDKDFVISLKVQ